MTIVLHRTGCGACKKAEKEITGQLITKENQGSKERFVVLDLKKMNDLQIREVGKLIPEAVTEKGIPTPLVANVKSQGNYFKFMQYSEDSNKENIDQVFKAVR